MDYPRDNVFTFLFSTYKRTAGIAFTAILILAIPITLTLLSRQQDIRQRAVTPEDDVCETLAKQVSDLEGQGICIQNSTKCNSIRLQMVNLNCNQPKTDPTIAPGMK